MSEWLMIVLSATMIGLGVGSIRRAKRYGMNPGLGLLMIIMGLMNIVMATVMDNPTGYKEIQWTINV